MQRNKTRGSIMAVGCIICLLLVNAQSQTRRKQKGQLATVTVKASLFYQFGGTQPAASTVLLVLNKNPEELMTSPVSYFATALVLREPFQVAARRCQVAEARKTGNEVQAEQLESLLDMELRTHGQQEYLQFMNNETPSEDETVESIRKLVDSHTIARGLTNNNGVAVIRGLPSGRKIYLLGMTRTRGGAAVWLFNATLKPINETLVLDQNNALIAF